MSKFTEIAKMLGIAVEDAAKLSPDVIKTLEKVPTAEAAVALKGAERAKYLSALDTVYGPQAKRSADMGFGKKDWYHGSTVPIDEFQKQALGASTGAQSAKKGFFFTSDPSTASDYANLASEKGVIREGDKVTTKWASDAHVEPDKISYSDVDAAKAAWNDALNKTPDFLKKKQAELENQLKGWEKARNADPAQYKYSFASAGVPAGDTNALADAMQAKLKDRFQRLYGNAKPATKQEIAAAKQVYFDKMTQFRQTNPELADKMQKIYLETKNPEEQALIQSAYKRGADLETSTGQNVTQVRLKGDPLVKNYKGESYRDETYSDLMGQAQAQGKDSALFMNTYDPADPNNRVKQNIAAVFEPSQVRSTNAAFDPRFKDSAKLLAGVSAAPMAADLGNDVTTPIKTAYNGLVNNVINPAVQGWEKAKSVITEPLSKQMDLTKDQSAAPLIKTGLNMGLDPLNYISGGVGDAIGAAQMLSTDDEGEKPNYAEGGEVEGFIPDHQFTPDAPTPVTNGPQTPDFIPDDQFVSDEDKYGGAGQQAITALEGAASGIAGPLAPLVEKHVLGVNPEDIRLRQETNPVTHGVGQAVGLGAGLITGTGEAGLMVKAGELAAGAAGLGKAAETATLGYKVGSAIVSQAAEMAVLQSGDEVSKLILNDPSQSAESALTNIGLSAALGGATGGLLEGTVKPLWSATAGPKVDDLLSKITNHLNGNSAILPEATESAIKDLGIEVAPEMRAAISNNPSLRESFTNLKYAQNPKIMASIDKLHMDASESVMNSLKIAPDDALNYSENEAGHDLLNAFKKEYNTRYEPLQKAFDKRNAEAATIFVPDEARLGSYEKLMVDGMEKLGTDSPYYKLYDEYGQRLLAKDTIGGMDQLKTEINNRIKGLKIGGDYNVVNALNDIKRSINDLQENQILKQSMQLEKEGVEFGSALGRDLNRERLELNKGYSDFANMSDELTNHLGIGDFYGAKTLENKLTDKITAEGLLNKFSFKNNADFIPFLQKNFPDTFSHVQENELKRLVKPAFLSAKGESQVNINKLNDIVEKGMAGKKEYIEQLLSPEALSKIKSAKTLTDAIPNPKDSGTPGGLAKVLKNMPASALAAIGAMGAHGAKGALSSGVAGALLGEMAHTLGKDAPEAIRLAYLKFMGSNQPIKAEGFKSMVDFFHNTYKGENLLAKASSNVFKAGAQVIGTHLMPDQKDRDTLDKAVTRLQKNPTQLMNSKDDLGHYLPNHQAAMAESSTRALQYLQSLKPHPTRNSPLDREIPPTKAQEARYQRALDIAQQPVMVLNHIKEGTLQSSDIQDLHNLYPALYKNLSQKLSNDMIKAQSNEEMVPYKTRMGISLFLGQPMDSTMQPMSIQAAQPKPTQQQQMSQGMQQPPQAALKNLGKTNKTYQTPSQSSETDRATRKAH